MEVDLLVKVGLGSLALGAVSGFALAYAVEHGERIKALGFRHPGRIRQVHLDWILMGIMLIAIGAAAPGLAGWIKALIIAGAIVNPLLFLPLGINRELQDNPVYRTLSGLSFTVLSLGLTAAFVSVL